MRSLIVALCTLALPFVSSAQADKSSWMNLSTLQPEQKIQVVELTSRKTTGKFSNVTDTAITLHEKSGEKTIQRQDVRTVRLMKNKHRLRNTLIGAGVGAGIGAGIGAASWRPCACFFPFSRGQQAALLGVVGFVGGAATGALWPTSEIIYRVPAPGS